MIKLGVYSVKGTKKDAISLPKDLEGKVNPNLLAQALRIYEDRKHPGLSKVKTRGEVRISTRKIYKQKGTGYARHGAKSAPIFVGGGVAHGPKGVKTKLTLSRKMRKNSLRVALSLSAKEGNLVVVDNLASLKKTKEVGELLTKIGKDQISLNKNPKFTFVVSQNGKNEWRALRNLKDVRIISYKNLNAHDVFYAGTLIFDKAAFSEAKPLNKEKLETTLVVTEKTKTHTSKNKPANKLKPSKSKKGSIKKANSKKGKKQ